MDIHKAIQLAFEHYRTGNLQQAENISKEILRVQLNNIVAINLLGIINYQLKNYDSAIKYMEKLINLSPNNAQAYYILGHSMQEKEQFDEAITYYQKALQVAPNFADVYYNLGSIFQDKKRHDEAISCYQKALQINPTDSDAYYNMGLVLQEKKQFDEAVTSYQKALQLNPNLADAYNNLGLSYREKGQFDEAISCYQKALQLNPNLADVYNNLGLSYREKGQFDEAISCYQKALQLNPNLADVYNNLGCVYTDKGQIDEAISCYQRALKLNPNLADAYNNLGLPYREKGQFDEAISSHQRALKLNPNLADAYNNLGCIYTDKGQIDEAEIWFRHAIGMKQDFSIAYSNLLFTMEYNAHHDPRTIYLEHLTFSKKYAEHFASTIYPHKNNRDPNRKLKIGYVSPDFRKHPVSCFIQPILIAHNREYFEVFCYSNSLIHDEVTKRIQEYADQWRNIVGIADGELNELIKKDEIDILVDLAGHTARNRILLFARKPAPIQISWIGYLATTGLSTMDYKIADNYTDPPGKTENFYTEKLMRLPKSCLCYLPNRDSPEVGPLPALSTGLITFGSFNNFAKVTSEVFTLWAKILNELPGSRLILKGNSFHDNTTCQYAINMFTQRGIAPDRITLQPSDPSPKHLESYNLVDIGLDTFPFNGATTTCEALWMGVPVITLEGTAYHSRVGVSLLSNVGLPALVAKTPDEYVELAVSLTTDIEKLSFLRTNLRDRMAHSPLCDAERFTVNLERCYRTMWETWCTSV
jgi:protein O-GlcNAc transferase